MHCSRHLNQRHFTERNLEFILEKTTQWKHWWVRKRKLIFLLAFRPMMSYMSDKCEYFPASAWYSQCRGFTKKKIKHSRQARSNTISHERVENPSFVSEQKNTAIALVVDWRWIEDSGIHSYVAEMVGAPYVQWGNLTMWICPLSFIPTYFKVWFL